MPKITMPRMPSYLHGPLLPITRNQRKHTAEVLGEADPNRRNSNIRTIILRTIATSAPLGPIKVKVAVSKIGTATLMTAI